MPVTYFVVVGANDSAIFEYPPQEESAAGRARQFRVHAALDMVDVRMWQTQNFYLPRVDVVEERAAAGGSGSGAGGGGAAATPGVSSLEAERYFVSAYVGHGPTRLLLMQDVEPYDTVQRFLAEAHELVVRHMMNPFAHPAAPIQSGAFRERFERIFARYF